MTKILYNSYKNSTFTKNSTFYNKNSTFKKNSTFNSYFLFELNDLFFPL